MSILSRTRTPVQEVLRDRPYLRADLIPLAATLCELGYHDGARNVILDSVASGTTLADLVRTGDLEPADLATARHSLLRGRRGRKRYRRVESIGDLLNVLVRALEASCVPTEEGSVSEAGLTVRLAGVPIRLAVVRPIAGGSGAADVDLDAPPAYLPPEADEDAEDFEDPADQPDYDPTADPRWEDTRTRPPETPGPYDPTPEDLADYAAWSTGLEDPMGFPAGHTDATRRAFERSIAEHFRLHPEG